MLFQQFEERGIRSFLVFLRQLERCVVVNGVAIRIDDVGGPQAERQQGAPTLAVADPHLYLGLVVTGLREESGKRCLELEEELLRFSAGHDESGGQLRLLVRPRLEPGRGGHPQEWQMRGGLIGEGQDEVLHDDRFGTGVVQDERQS
ncbi:hypothetical protein ACIGXF_27040 [Streptomyces sp. NPDC053086]|uniref:hypothetical protein n=1 Tax=unclassified Streptomyces TaxID=2593676 RepID=UPI0037D1A67A